MKIWIPCLLLLTLLACKPEPVVRERPVDLIPKFEFTEILVQTHLIEGAISRRVIRGADPKYFGARHYEALFDQFGVTQDQFSASYAYYYEDKQEMNQIYNTVLQELSKLESEENKPQKRPEVSKSDSTAKAAASTQDSSATSPAASDSLVGNK